MRLGAVPESPAEWLALRSGRVPTPLIETHLAFVWARTLMVATRLGVFEALAAGPRAADAVAAACATQAEPTRRLLDALTGMGYLSPSRLPSSSEDGYASTPVARRWLTRSSAHEVVDKVLFSFDEWEFVTAYDLYLTTGTPVRMHERFSAEEPETGPVAGHPPAPAERHSAPAAARHAAPAAARRSDAAAIAVGGATTAWERYQRGLYTLAKVSAGEVARRTPVPRGARDLLDIGGGHGRFAAALLGRHTGLRAVVLDLPAAADAAAPLIAGAGLGDRLRQERGDVLTMDLGVATYDVVLASQFTHHLGDDANAELAVRVARALRPGGVYVIQDLVRPAGPREAQRARLGALLDLYFAVTSGAGTVTLDTMRRWQSGAGLVLRRPVWMRTLPGMVQQAASKAQPRRG